MLPRQVITLASCEPQCCSHIRPADSSPFVRYRSFETCSSAYRVKEIVGMITAEPNRDGTKLLPLLPSTQILCTALGGRTVFDPVESPVTAMLIVRYDSHGILFKRTAAAKGASLNLAEKGTEKVKQSRTACFFSPVSGRLWVFCALQWELRKERYGETTED